WRIRRSLILSSAPPIGTTNPLDPGASTGDGIHAPGTDRSDRARNIAPVGVRQPDRDVGDPREREHRLCLLLDVAVGVTVCDADLVVVLAGHGALLVVRVALAATALEDVGAQGTALLAHPLLAAEGQEQQTEGAGGQWGTDHRLLLFRLCCIS